MPTTKQNLKLVQKKYRKTDKGREAYARANLKYQGKYRKHLRETVFEHYGYACELCGETEPSKLTIDHIDGNGKEHREEIHSTGGYHFYRWLINSNFPDGFQTLCISCNSRKH